MANQGPVAKLRKMHPERQDLDLVHALRQAGETKDPWGQARVIRAGLLLQLMREKSRQTSSHPFGHAGAE